MRWKTEEERRGGSSNNFFQQLQWATWDWWLTSLLNSKPKPGLRQTIRKSELCVLLKHGCRITSSTPTSLCRTSWLSEQTDSDVRRSGEGTEVDQECSSLWTCYFDVLSLQSRHWTLNKFPASILSTKNVCRCYFGNRLPSTLSCWQ